MGLDLAWKDLEDKKMILRFDGLKPTPKSEVKKSELQLHDLNQTTMS